VDRTVPWDGFYNTRDLGGLPTLDGGMTRPGAYYRSAELRLVTPAGWQAAYEAGVRTILDLRNADEIGTGAPGVPPGMVRVEVALDGIEDVEFWQEMHDLSGTPLYYRPFLDRMPDRCAALFRALAAAEPGVLFHCGAGRDRAGLVALLLLSLAGVEPAAIAADYLATTEPLRALRAALQHPDDEPVVAALLAERGSTLSDAVLAVLDGFAAASYLRTAGVPAADLALVRDRLVRQSPDPVRTR
jgi:protein-tyrosine phosphatase